MNSHEHYEELCALAASGQLSQAEGVALKAHLEDCPSCRGFSDDLMRISRELSVLGAERSHSVIPSGMAERFAARARYEDIEINRNAVTAMPKRGNRITLPVLSAAAAAVLIVAGIALWKAQRFSSSAVTAHNQVETRTPQPSAMTIPSLPGSQSSDTEVTQQLASARSKVAVLNTTIQAQRDELDALKRAKEVLSSQLSDTQKQNSGLESEASEWQLREQNLRQELEKSKSDKTASDVALALQESELKQLREEVDRESDQLRQQEELTARGGDVRDLVVARNLHIIDVHDRDGDGKSQRAFGRIFYTEGKSLIFYAYDLSDPQKVETRVSFCVWGERLGADKPIKSLGVLHNDDAREGRWVLTFDDPQVLAQIDSVFVTAESSRKSIHEPGGKRILFAFLGEKPNHP